VESETEMEGRGHDQEKEKDEEEKEEYIPGSFVVAVYAGQWYVGTVLDKKEKLALNREDYVYVSFMKRVDSVNDTFRWPDKVDKLNVLKEDLLFKCDAPSPVAGTSSSRKISYTLSKVEI